MTNDPTPRYLRKWNENWYSHKSLHIDFYNSIIHTCKNLVQPKCLQQMNEQTMVRSQNGTLLNNEKAKINFWSMQHIDNF